MHQISKIYFVTKLYMFRTSSVTIIRNYQLYIGNWYVSGRLCGRFLRESGWNSPRKRLHNLHETCHLPSVQLITPDDGHRRFPKHVEFRDKINFEYLMYLVGYLYEAYHDAGSPEHKAFLRHLPCGRVVTRFINSRNMYVIHTK
jgi:hypothetical protein